MDSAAARTEGAPSGGGAGAPAIQSVIAGISHIATLPQVTLRVIELVEDPESTAEDLTRVISNDPALGTRILKVVNSAFYGLPGQVGSIKRAIVLLGLNAVKNIAIAASLSKLFRGGQICPGFDAKDLWTHCIAVATATNLLAREARFRTPDEAFLAGLIHDIGIMVEIQGRRPQFAQTIEALHADPKLTMRRAEVKYIGAHHEQFGAALCRAWKFPDYLALVAGFHHQPLAIAGNEYGMLPCLVHTADVLVASRGIGFTRTVECKAVDPDVLDRVKLTSDQVEKILTKLNDAIDEARTIVQDTP